MAGVLQRRQEVQITLGINQPSIKWNATMFDYFWLNDDICCPTLLFVWPPMHPFHILWTRFYSRLPKLHPLFWCQMRGMFACGPSIFFLYWLLHSVWKNPWVKSQPPTWTRPSITGSSLAVFYQYESHLTFIFSYCLHLLKIPFEWQEQVLRSCIALKMCSFEETGAMMASITSSIPVDPKAQGYDLRYCWLRDSSNIIHTLNKLGSTKTMEEFLKYISNIVGSSEVCYTIIATMGYQLKLYF